MSEATFSYVAAHVLLNLYQEKDKDCLSITPGFRPDNNLLYPFQGTVFIAS